MIPLEQRRLRSSFRCLSRRLPPLALLVALSGCCEFREAGLDAAVAPYRTALRSHFERTGACPADLSDLAVPLPNGLTKEGNQLRGLGGNATYLRSGPSSCRIVTGGFSFCGLCYTEGNGQGDCYH